MKKLDRRTFVGLSAAAVACAFSKQIPGQTIPPHIAADDQSVHVSSARYSWSYSRDDDIFRLLDAKRRLIVTGSLQPAVVVASSADPSRHQCVPGRALPPQATAGRVRFDYETVNGNGHLSVTVRFEDEGFWIEPVLYESAAAEDVVSLHYFTRVRAEVRTPSLDASVFVVPGISEGPSVSPIQGHEVHLDQTLWLGHGSSIPDSLIQQWALPVDYFCGFSLQPLDAGLHNTYSDGRSEAFVCGLADLPNGDLFLDLHEGRSSMWIDYRSDLWKHLRTPGKLTLGSTLCWALGGDYYEAIGQYYGRLLNAGVIERKTNSAKKNAAALAPQFCTWGSEVDREGGGGKLDEAFLNEIYKELKASGMEARMFSIDDKWEGHYGTLEHSVERFPHFEQFLDQVRADGYRIGLWTAFMRCEDPSALGLSLENMLRQPDGQPFKLGGEASYYILDFTQPEVSKVLTGRVRSFIRRYKPDLVKFDFGYELPAIRTAAPADKSWAGERLLAKGLEVVVQAMRAENPDIVVMYYQLSPLHLKYFDLHALDDLFLAAGEYDLEANRRIYFSSLMGPLGIPTYGSSGYDWSSAPSIWFDSAAVGTLGTLNDLRADELGEGQTPERMAKFNGLAHTLRPGNIFSIIPFAPMGQPYSPTRGAHSSSWARMENGELMLIALRPTLPHQDDSAIKQPPDPRVAGIVESTSPVVVASQTNDSITKSERIVVVPYGDGQASIRRQRGHNAEITTHHFGGSTTHTAQQIKNGSLELTLRERSETGFLVEWLEVSISS
jgi:hypothetical protein